MRAFSRMRLPFVLALLVTTFVLLTTQSLGLVSAQAPYNVQAGDTLLSIAIKLGVSDGRLNGWMDDVVQLNSLPSADALSIGQTLTLPAAGSAASSASTPASASARASGTTYTVRDGDTLYDLAAKNAIPAVAMSSWLDSILQLNSLASADSLQPGDVLRLPKVTGAGSTSGGAVSTSVNTSITTSYTVRPGDTLHDIASKSGIAEGTLTAWIEAVLKLNSLGSADLLQEGGVLKIPSKTSSSAASGSSTAKVTSTSTTTYIVRPGDTLYDIAAKNGAGDNIASWVDTVLSLNSLESADMLREGAVLKVPGTASNTNTSTSASAAAPAQTTTYTIVSGDTLYDIADKNGVSEGLGSWIDSVLSLNSLESADMLREGAVLKVPFIAGRSSAPETPTPASASAGASAPLSNTYTVRAGETFQGIARKLGVGEDVMSIWIDQVVMLSRINRNDPLVDGEILLVPAPPTSQSQASGNSAPASSSNSSRKKPTTSYTVAAGDTLSQIASKFKVGTTQLSGWFKEVLDMNSLNSADMIAVGQKLVVPGEDTAQPQANPTASATPPSIPGAPGAAPVSQPTSTPNLVRGPNGTCFYTVLAGDSWDSIARKLGVSDSSKAAWIDGIGALNGISGKPLPVGDAIRMLC